MAHPFGLVILPVREPLAGLFEMLRADADTSGSAVANVTTRLDLQEALHRTRATHGPAEHLPSPQQDQLLIRAGHPVGRRELAGAGSLGSVTFVYPLRYPWWSDPYCQSLDRPVVVPLTVQQQRHRS